MQYLAYMYALPHIASESIEPIRKTHPIRTFILSFIGVLVAVAVAFSAFTVLYLGECDKLSEQIMLQTSEMTELSSNVSSQIATSRELSEQYQPLSGSGTRIKKAHVSLIADCESALSDLGAYIGANSRSSRSDAAPAAARQVKRLVPIATTDSVDVSADVASVAWCPRQDLSAPLVTQAAFSEKASPFPTSRNPFVLDVPLRVSAIDAHDIVSLNKRVKKNDEKMAAARRAYNDLIRVQISLQHAQQADSESADACMLVSSMHSGEDAIVACNGYEDDLDMTALEYAMRMVPLAPITASDKAAAIEAAINDIMSAKDAVDAARAEAARLAEEEARHAQAAATRGQEYVQADEQGDSSAGANDGIWRFSYYDRLWGAADEGGAMTRWADRYWIAHNWSYNGTQIAARHQYVEVDGVLYRYVSEQIVVPSRQYWECIEEFVHANGGIGFQTCCGDGNYLVTHYEPV